SDGVEQCRDDGVALVRGDRAVAANVFLIDLELDAAVARIVEQRAQVARQSIRLAAIGIVATRRPLRQPMRKRALPGAAQRALPFARWVIEEADIGAAHVAVKRWR